MKDFKEKLFKEMDERMPEMSKRLEEYPITLRENKFKFNLNWKICTPILTIILLALIVIPFLFNDKKPTRQVYMLEVNPTLLIETDKDGIVTEIKSGNKDADEVIISLNKNDLIGKDLNYVSEVIADELLQLGYFDANDSNIMKITATNDGKELEETLNKFFNEQGYFVAILTDEFDLDHFNEAFDTDLKEIDGIYNLISELDDYYLERVNFDNVNIEEVYKTEYLETYLKETLEKELETIILVTECLQDVTANYQLILECEEIPFYAREYWLAKNYYSLIPTELTDDIKLLLDNMENSLNQYYELTGEEISDSAELISISTGIATMPITEILDIINNIHQYITSSEYDSKINELFSFLEAVIPSVSEELNELKDIPTDVDEFVSKIKTISQNNNTKKKDKYLQEYQKQKDKLTNEGYKEKVQEIINEYGSLGNYWKNKKNNQ